VVDSTGSNKGLHKSQIFKFGEDVDVLFDEEIDEEEPAERKGTWDSFPVTDLPQLYISTN
jgi:hypothetical protein